MSAPTLTDAEVGAMYDEHVQPKVNSWLWAGLGAHTRGAFTNFADAAFARGVAAVKGVDPEFKVQYERLAASQDAVKREAAREALTRCASHMRYTGFAHCVTKFRDDAYPAPRPAPPTVLTCAVCGIADKGVRDGVRDGENSHPDLLHCVGALGAKVAAFAAAHTEGSTDGR